jgi:hypothetical protein
MRSIPLLGLFLVAVSAHAAPPPDANGQFRDWFRSLRVPGLPDAPCCTLADCRMVEARWNDGTQHYEAMVAREAFVSVPGKPISSQQEDAAVQLSKNSWQARWSSRYGDSPAVWIEVPEAKINPVRNPIGHAVLCWSLFNAEFNGVFCFIPYEAA